jgi:hypothetical protein
LYFYFFSHNQNVSVQCKKDFALGRLVLFS